MAKGEKATMKHGTVIMRCTCEHDYQDQNNGKGNRVFNRCSGNNARCTVCGKSKTVGS